ncbi:ABC-type glutathione transport system ATPase component [Peribacillus simplex]|uniref:ATP-binding cassette domain-containing protein n=1 Tax=Peribacillus simplex TaxID=1478 RepID=UPI0024E1E292|nr:ABC transporter ATP-binding protein [Peribacillus simplex]MDF9763475.1 ABC-type glutathione transport system ATPase component [Peribacillus simplex]
MKANINPLLSMEHVEISYQDAGKWKTIVHDISFQLFPGEMVALTGPSGCGKSLTAHAMVGLLDKGFRVTNGRIIYKNENILEYDERRLQQLRRDEIALLIQHSLNGLNPIQTVKKQMVDTVRQKKKWDKNDMQTSLHPLLKQVGLLDSEQILSSYPFELSGGMRQRVLLAMMLSLQPKIFIADEPTTALDVINREKVLALLKQLQQELNLTILLISHDEKSVKKYANRVVQIDQGGIVL